jgi:hypothetical protein
MTNRTRRRINWPVVFSGIALFCIQLSFLPSTVEFVRTSKVAQAEVVGLNAGGKHPQVEFTTFDGEHISVPTSSWFRSVSVGDKVEMRYDPKHPRIARINSLFGVWFLHLFCGVPAIVLAVGGLLGLSGKGSEFEEGNDSK